MFIFVLKDKEIFNLSKYDTIPFYSTFNKDGTILCVLFNNNNNSYTLSFSSCDQNLQSATESSRSKVESVLNDFQKKKVDNLKKGLQEPKKADRKSVV